jgi:hypothetical protein
VLVVIVHPLFSRFYPELCVALPLTLYYFANIPPISFTDHPKQPNSVLSLVCFLVMLLPTYQAAASFN